MDKLRLRFKKTGRAVYISHLDLMDTIQRAFSRAEYGLKYSEGFNPRPQISIALPLSVGTGSVCEVMDFKLRCETALDDFPQRLTAAMPEAARAAASAAIPMGKPGRPEDVAAAIAFLAGESAGYITGQLLCIDGGMGM